MTAQRRQPRNARKVGSQRVYEWRSPGVSLDEPPQRFWSVTTILKGALPAPALMNWGMKSVAEFAVANYRQLSAMCSASYRFTRGDDGTVSGVIGDPDGVQAAIDWLKGSPYRERDRKADLGSRVHEYAEAH